MNILEEIKCLGRSKSMRDEELVKVFETAKKVKGTILEIGCYQGISTICLAKGSNQKVITVDPFIAHGDIEQNKQTFLNNMKRLKVDHLIELKHAYSKDVDVGEISLLLIDGDHSYDGVKHDYLKFAPKIKKGGYIIMHDFHLPGIKKFFDEEIWKDITKFEEFSITTSLIVIKK